jgi:hypothetical protein
MKVFELRLWIDDPHPDFAFKGNGFVTSLHILLRKDHGGSCHGQATDRLLIAQIRAPGLETFAAFADAFVIGLRERIPSLKLLIDEAPHSTLTQAEQQCAESLNAEPIKLTRKYFTGLKPGCFVASNVWSPSGGGEAFAATVAESAEARQLQWQQIVENGAAQRLCRTFPSEQHFKTWSDQMRRYFGLPQ